MDRWIERYVRNTELKKSWFLDSVSRLLANEEKVKGKFLIHRDSLFVYRFPSFDLYTIENLETLDK